MTFVDITTVTLIGMVSVANTAQYNGGQPCPVVGAEVCILNHFGVHEKLVCTTTDSFGLLQQLFVRT